MLLERRFPSHASNCPRSAVAAALRDVAALRGCPCDAAALAINAVRGGVATALQPVDSANDRIGATTGDGSGRNTNEADTVHSRWLCVACGVASAVRMQSRAAAEFPQRITARFLFIFLFRVGCDIRRAGLHQWGRIPVLPAEASALHWRRCISPSRSHSARNALHTRRNLRRNGIAPFGVTFPHSTEDPWRGLHARLHAGRVESGAKGELTRNGSAGRIAGVGRV